MKKKLKIGSLELDSNVIYAPLAGCSDFPFRKMSARYRPALMFCEMVKMEALLRKIPETYRMLDYSEEMHPIGGQVCGSNPELAGASAKIIEDLGFDVVDLNCGCPVDKITKDGSGSAMLKNPNLIGDMISRMVASVKIPVTLKVRAGWNDSTINADLITQIAEEAGASAIFVHGRTRQQAYQGPAKWKYIKACKDVAKKIVVIGNGDIFDAPAALRMIDETGCDGVLVSRGTMGQPWIVQEILALMEGVHYTEKTPKECIEALSDHFRYSQNYKHEKAALLDMRRVSCWYLKNTPGARDFRAKASKALSLQEVWDLIEGFPLL